MSAASNGGPVRPGTAWSDPDEREAFFPAAGAIRATERVLTEDLQPDPIALSERLPGDGDILKAGPCSLAWLGRELPGGYWHWELADLGFATLYTHWLPASVRYLPARVEL